MGPDCASCVLDTLEINQSLENLDISGNPLVETNTVRFCNCRNLARADKIKKIIDGR